jgi:acetyl-CoA carboxylase biotin carboxyl carrier protein
MKAEEIQHLLNFIATSGLDEVNIETDNLKLSVKRSAAQVVVQAAPAPVAAAPAPVTPAPVAAAAPAPAPAAPAPVAAPAANTITQKSPMIGTFYAASTPEAPPLAKVGDVVKKGQIVCIIEAMKLFNEIESDFDGKIVQVLVNNSSPVEYDQPLFIIEPA